MRRTVRRAGALMVAGTLVVALGACGDDDDSAADDVAAADGDQAAGADEFCEAAVAVDAANLAGGSGEATPDEVEAALQEALDTAPDEIADAVDTMVAEARAQMEASASADEDGPPPLPGDDFYPASVEVGGFLTGECDLPALDIEATDYAFGGIPETVPAGTTVLNFANDGAEFHEAVVMKIADGEERPVEELLTLPDEEAMALVTEKAFVLAPPDAATYVTADLEPGRYVALCFVPVGTTPEAMAGGAPSEEADPHFAHGMVAEFTVT